MFWKIKELKYLAYHDALTGLLNRNWLYKNIYTIKSNFVYFIDINNLREINKNGHTAGDDRIKEVIRYITSIMSQTDILVRYGGDEFILFSYRWNALASTNLITVGKASKSDNLFSMTDAIKEADRDMIKNKNTQI